MEIACPSRHQNPKPLGSWPKQRKQENVRSIRTIFTSAYHASKVQAECPMILWPILTQQFKRNFFYFFLQLFTLKRHDVEATVKPCILLKKKKNSSLAKLPRCNSDFSSKKYLHSMIGKGWSSCRDFITRGGQEEGSYLLSYSGLVLPPSPSCRYTCTDWLSAAACLKNLILQKWRS